MQAEAGWMDKTKTKTKAKAERAAYRGKPAGQADAALPGMLLATAFMAIGIMQIGNLAEIIAAALERGTLTHLMIPRLVSVATAWPILWMLCTACVKLARTASRRMPPKKSRILLAFPFAIGVILALSGEHMRKWLYSGDISGLFMGTAPVTLPTLSLLLDLERPRKRPNKYVTVVIPKKPDITKAGPKAIAIACAAYSALSFMLLETQLDGPVAVTVQYSILNIAYWACLYSMLAFATNSLKIPGVACIALSWAIGAANLEMLTWRGDYVTFRDLIALETGLQIGSQYEINVTPKLVIIAMIAIAMIAMTCRLPLPRPGLDVKARIALPSLMLMAFAVSYPTGLMAPGISPDQADVKTAVDSYGYLSYLIAGSKAGDSVEPPDGYSPEQVASTLMAYETTGPGPFGDDMPPDIILIQNESWADLSVIGEIEFDKDPFEYLKSLDGNVRKYAMDVPNPHGPTAYAEFEVMARSSMAWLPAGCSPIMQYAVSDCIPSLADTLKDQPVPYSTVFFHPYRQTAYRRYEAYPALGFDETIFYDDWTGKETIRGLVSDQQAIDDLIAIYEDQVAKDPESPVFLFNVTIQSHGAYNPNQAESIPWRDRIEITNFDAGGELDIWANSMHETDMALESLIRYLSNTDRKVLLCMYGDHQPYVSGEGLAPVFERAWSGDSQYETAMNYVVPCVIWANYEIPAHDGYRTGGGSIAAHEISSCYLASHLLDLAGARLSAYDRYLLDMWSAYPSVTSLGTWDSDGAFHENRSQYGLMPERDAIQYAMLFDEEADKAPFLP